MHQPIDAPGAQQVGGQGPNFAPLSLAEMTTLLIKHHGLHEGTFETSFSLGINIGGFIAPPDHKPYPGAAVFVQGVQLAAVAADAPNAVDAAAVNPAPKAE